MPIPGRVLVYEYTCSGGILAASTDDKAASLMREGWAMLHALTTDLVAIRDVTVQVLADHRGLPGVLPGCESVPVHTPDEERTVLAQLAVRADWTIVIAPEFDGILADRCCLVEAHGGRLLGPSSNLVALLSDKHGTAEYLARHQVPTPPGILWRPGDCPPSRPCPVVVKPNDGAGAQECYVCTDWSQFHAVLKEYRRPARIEPFAAGFPASVAFLCGPAGNFSLPACAQRLTTNRQIAYLGGGLPLSAALDARARRIAAQAINSLTTPCGYIGVDLVLGDDPDGAQDYVIEINPRLTTSYVGLRAQSLGNLAAALIATAEGHPVDLSFSTEYLEFDANGTLHRPNG